MHDVPMPGCRPEPLAHYLKALAVLRLVAEQVDPGARGWWAKDVFWLRSSLDEDGLLRFFLEEYRPTPIVVPWSGADFFGVDTNRRPERYASVPTASRVIEAVLATTSDRLAPYRQVLRRTLEVMAAQNITEKKAIEGNQGKANKVRLINALRAALPEEVVAWIDAASLVREGDLVFNNLLGSGGGNDGNTHFSDNFMQCLWLCLPDFAEQKTRDVPGFSARAGLAQALFGQQNTNSLIKGRSPGLYNSFDVGGPNAGNGFEREARNNPWDYILTLEAMLCFGGAVTRRIGVATEAKASFPFLVQASPAGYASASDGEYSGREVWLPLWGRPAAAEEVKYLFAEGRAQVGRRNAAVGTDFARAVASLGTDRGIEQFQRYGLLRGRVGGDNYHTAVSFGRWRVTYRPQANLLAEIDAWLDRFRGAAVGSKAPARAKVALRVIERAIFDFCQVGGPRLFSEILIALGLAEQVMAASPKFRADTRLSPIPLLSTAWLDAAYDGSAEFRLAAALASTGLREYMEPVRAGAWVTWLEDNDPPRVVWGERDLVRNLGEVLRRKVVEARRDEKAEALPHGTCTAALGDVAAFIRREVDDRRLEALLKGLCLLDWSNPRTLAGPPEPLPPVLYRLLKLVHLPHPLRDVTIPLNGAVLPRALAGDAAQAGRLAVNRLRASGLVPLVDAVYEPPATVTRVAAALMFPLAARDDDRLANTVLRPPKDPATVA